MKLIAPANVRRIRCHCLGDKCSVSFATSIGSCHFEVEDCFDVIVFSACDNAHVTQAEWLWADGEWTPMGDPKAERRLKKALKRSEPESLIADLNDAPGPIVPPELYKAAEAYTKEYDKRNTMVAKAFRKVTK